MATNDWDDDDDFDFEDQGQNNQGSNDGDLVKKLRKALRAKEKENKDLAERFESVSKVQREQIVNQVLNQKGVNPKAARLILKTWIALMKRRSMACLKTTLTFSG